VEAQKASELKAARGVEEAAGALREVE